MLIKVNLLYIYIYEYNHNKGQKNFKREDKKLKAKNGELHTNTQNVAKGNAKLINIYKYSKIL